jgi:diadenylate cyclase
MILYERHYGAILLDRSGGHIIHANVQLMPDSSIESQDDAPPDRRTRTSSRCFAIPSLRLRRDHLSARYPVIMIRSVILDKADQALQTLELGRLNQVSTCCRPWSSGRVLSRRLRYSGDPGDRSEIERHIIELGNEGRLVQLQLEELMVDVREDRGAILADYLPDPSPERLAEAREALRALGRTSCFPWHDWAMSWAMGPT